MTQTDPPTVSFNIVPGAGEIFQQPFLTDRGVVAAVLVEAVPGGPLEPITHNDHAADLSGFAAALLDVIDAHAPTRRPASTRPVRSARTARRAARRGHPDSAAGWATLPDGRLALAIGDAWIANDPITGQGANIGSHCAWVTADALATCDRVRRQLRRTRSRTSCGRSPVR